MQIKVLSKQMSESSGKLNLEFQGKIHADCQQAKPDFWDAEEKTLFGVKPLHVRETSKEYFE